MDYPVLNKSPNVAPAVVPHTIDANGNAVPVGSANPSPVEYFPKPLIATATAMTRPTNVTVYSAGDAVSNNATAASVTPISFPASDVNNAPLLLAHVLADERGQQPKVRATDHREDKIGCRRCGQPSSVPAARRRRATGG